MAIKTKSETAARAFADVLTREVIPQRGTVRVAGHALNDLHQSVVANCIGYAHSKPHIFQGTLGDNLMLPFKRQPVVNGDLPTDILHWKEEAKRSGNSLDPFELEWVDPSVAGLASADAIHEWWFQLVEAMGIDDFMVRRALRSHLDPATQKDLADAIVSCGPRLPDV